MLRCFLLSAVVPAQTYSFPIISSRMPKISLFLGLLLIVLTQYPSWAFRLSSRSHSCEPNGSLRSHRLPPLQGRKTWVKVDFTPDTFSDRFEVYRKYLKTSGQILQARWRRGREKPMYRDLRKKTLRIRARVQQRRDKLYQERRDGTGDYDPQTLYRKPELLQKWSPPIEELLAGGWQPQPPPMPGGRYG